jgi:hypothetical protein
VTFDERVQTVQAFGLRPRQACFLAHVALHSGYCLRRHYTDYTRTRKGKNTQRFFQDLVARELATPLRFRADRGDIFHVHHPGLYRALALDHNRNQRHVSPALIARRLMLLDVVLAQPNVTWLATETDKVATFTSQFRVAHENLPRRTLVARDAPRTTRYFLHKLPIALVGTPPEPHFVYLATDTTVPAFVRFLREHARLLSALPSWAIVIAHPRHVLGQSAWKAAFASLQINTTSSLSPALTRDLERYFATRTAVERHQLAGLSVADLQGFREARLRFAEPLYEAWFARWLASGSPRLSAAAEAAGTFVAGRLLLHELPHRYEQFGAFPGVL